MVLGIEGHFQRFRSERQYDEKLPVFNSQASLVFIDPLKERMAKFTLPSSSREFQTCGMEARYAITQLLGFLRDSKHVNLTKHNSFLCFNMQFVALMCD
ncbi:hypothetical protein TNCV_3037161 [Trichonephila clavipes]|nr:hypothetical protein TNCV_3037161 [Trichonephila clavipes]